MIAYFRPGPTVVAIEFKISGDKAQLLQGLVSDFFILFFFIKQ